MYPGPDKEMLLFDSCERWMVWEHLTLPLLDGRRRPTGFDFLELAVDKMWQLTICAVAVVVPWRLLCNKIVVVRNRRILLTIKSPNQDATGSSTRGRLETPLHLQMRMLLGALQVDSYKSLTIWTWGYNQECYTWTPRTSRRNMFV